MTSALEVKGIKKRYGSKEALRGVDIDIAQGEIVGLIGSNGAGKSTLINILVGLIKQDEGEVKYGFTQFVAKQDIGVMCQEVSMPEKMRVSEWLKMVSLFYNDPYDLNDILKLSRVERFADKYANKLSGGQKRRVQFALAIIGKPRILFLDEPTVGMDIEARIDFWNQMQRMANGGVTILLASHDLAEVESIVDRVLIIDEGKIVLNKTKAAIQEHSAVAIKILKNTLDKKQRESVENFSKGFENVIDSKDAIKIIPENAEETVVQLQKYGLTYMNFEVQKQGLQEMVQKSNKGEK